MFKSLDVEVDFSFLTFLDGRGSCGMSVTGFLILDVVIISVVGLVSTLFEDLVLLVFLIYDICLY